MRHIIQNDFEISQTKTGLGRGVRADLFDSFIVMYVKSWNQLYNTPKQIVMELCLLSNYKKILYFNIKLEIKCILDSGEGMVLLNTDQMLQFCLI